MLGVEQPEPSGRRSTSSPASAATTSWPRCIADNRRLAYGQGLHPRRARPRLRHRPSRLRRQRDQRPPRHGPGRGVHSLHREDLPGRRRSRRPVAQWPFLGRLEQPLAPGDLSRRLRRHLVDQPRPGRLPRLPADRPVRPGENMFRDRAGQAAADRPDGRGSRALLRRFLPDGRRHRLGRPARLVRGRLQPARRRRAGRASSGTAPPAPSTPRSPGRGKPTTSGWSSSATGRRSARSSRGSSTSSWATSIRSTSKGPSSS